MSKPFHYSKPWSAISLKIKWKEYCSCARKDGISKKIMEKIDWPSLS
jgi:hypothetical protein